MKLVVVVAALAVFAGCQKQDEAQQAAQGFVDQHYVHIDLVAAKKFTTGLATAKIEEEEKLIAGVTQEEGTAKPRVHYELLERRPEGEDRVTFLYKGEARGEDANDVFTRKWLVTVKRDSGDWKVSNFHEFD